MHLLGSCAVSSHCSRCVCDIWPGLSGKPHNKRTYQLAERPVTHNFSLVQISKSHTCRKWNALSFVYSVFLDQLNSLGRLRNLQRPPLPISFVKTSREKTQLPKILHRNHLVKVPSKLITPVLLSYNRLPSTAKHTRPPKTAQNPKNKKHLARCACHCLDACFKPYKLLFSFTIIPGSQPQPSGNCMYTSSSKGDCTTACSASK